MLKEIGLCVALCLVAGLQRYAVAYGYQGMSKRRAWVDARNVAVMLAAICAVLLTLAANRGH